MARRASPTGLARTWLPMKSVKSIVREKVSVLNCMFRVNSLTMWMSWLPHSMGDHFYTRLWTTFGRAVSSVFIIAASRRQTMIRLPSIFLRHFGVLVGLRVQVNGIFFP